MLRVGWFATGRGQTSPKLLTAALDAIHGGLDAEIAFVFSNQEPGDSENGDAFFDLVRGAGIPLITLSDVKFRRAVGGKIARKGGPLPAWRHQYDAGVAELLAPHHFDLGVMAGYLLIITESLYDRWPVLNLHPALPGGPIGLWQDVVWQLIGEGATESGVLMFLANGDLDRGPAITYSRYSLRSGDIEPLWATHGNRPLEELRTEGDTNPLFQAVRVRGIARELPLVVETVRAFAEGRVRIERLGPAFQALDAAGKPLEAYDLTDKVEPAVRAAESQREVGS